MSKYTNPLTQELLGDTSRSGVETYPKDTHNLKLIEIDYRERGSGKRELSQIHSWKVSDAMLKDSLAYVNNKKMIVDQSTYTTVDDDDHASYIENELREYIKELQSLTKDKFIHTPENIKKYEELLGKQTYTLNKWSSRQFNNTSKYEYDVAKQWHDNLIQIQAQRELIDVTNDPNQQSLTERSYDDETIEEWRETELNDLKNAWVKKLPSVGSATISKYKNKVNYKDEKADYICYDINDKQYLAIELKSTFMDWVKVENRFNDIVEAKGYYQNQGVEYRLRIVRPDMKDNSLKPFFNENPQSEFKTKSEFSKWWSPLLKRLEEKGVQVGYYAIGNIYGSSPSLNISQYMRYNERCNLIADRILCDARQEFRRVIL